MRMGRKSKKADNRPKKAKKAVKSAKVRKTAKASQMRVVLPEALNRLLWKLIFKAALSAYRAIKGKLGEKSEEQ